MIEKAIAAIETAFNVGSHTHIGFYTEDLEMRKYLNYFIETELEKHVNGEFQLVKKERFGWYRLYNGSYIQVFKNMDELRGRTIDHLFVYSNHEEIQRSVEPTMKATGRQIHFN